MSINLFPGHVPLDATFLDIAQITHLLGYPPDYAIRLNQELHPYEQRRVVVLVEELTAIDAQLKETLTESAITKTCNTELNWSQQLRFLKRQGGELLKELARIYRVRLDYNKYVVSTPVTIQYQ